MLIRCAVTAQLICVFVFAYAKQRGSVMFPYKMGHSGNQYDDTDQTAFDIEF